MNSLLTYSKLNSCKGKNDCKKTEDELQGRAQNLDLGEVEDCGNKKEDSDDEIGGNGNYAIGIAKNGAIQRTIYMLDSAGVWSGNAEDYELTLNGYQVLNKRAMFQDEQIAWYRSVSARVNAHEGKDISSLMSIA